MTHNKSTTMRKRYIKRLEKLNGGKILPLRRHYNRRRAARRWEQNYVVLTKKNSMNYKNLYGETLKPCSRPGMAMTGFTRDGECRHHDGGSGRHNVCIDISSTTGGNFCTVTGQPNWCEEDMPCHGESSGKCGIENWCVCEWAFASYIENAGGCDKIADVVCESTNAVVLDHYKNSKEPHVQRALECLEEKCQL